MKKSEAKKRKKKVMLIATLSTAAVIVGGLTFAWYTSRDEVTNTFKSAGNLRTVVVENFNPPTNWQPGVTTDKVVQVTNTGTLDAYTRVTLTPTLAFDYKGKAVDYTSSLTLSKLAENAVDGTTGYTTVDANAIDDAVANWNKDTSNTDKFVLWNGTSASLTSSEVTAVTDKTAAEYAPLKAMLDDKLSNNLTSNVTLYVKASQGDSKDTDDETVETGYNYEILGYVKSGDDYFEIQVVPTDVSYTNDAATNGYSLVTSTLESELKIQVFEATHKVYSYTTDEGKKAIDDIITINLNKDIVGTVDSHPASPLWIERVGDDGNILYYYNTVLESGESTKALVNSVTFNKDYKGYPVTGSDNTVTYAEINNLVYNLNVEALSTQATVEAAVDTFGGDGANDCDTTKGETNKLSDNSNAVYQAILDTNGAEATSTD
jgi:alternate signal-mediated exported protein